jgi:hypothetical protein
VSPELSCAPSAQQQLLCSVLSTRAPGGFRVEVLHDCGLAGAEHGLLLPALCVAEPAQGASGRAAAVTPVGVFRGLEGREYSLMRFCRSSRAWGLSL